MPYLTSLDDIARNYLKKTHNFDVEAHPPAEGTYMLQLSGYSDPGKDWGALVEVVAWHVPAHTEPSIFGSDIVERAVEHARDAAAVWLAANVARPDEVQGYAITRQRPFGGVHRVAGIRTVIDLESVPSARISDGNGKLIRIESAYQFRVRCYSSCSNRRFVNDVDILFGRLHGRTAFFPRVRDHYEADATSDDSAVIAASCFPDPCFPDVVCGPVVTINDGEHIFSPKEVPALTERRIVRTVLSWTGY